MSVSAKQERAQILGMVSEGKISAEEGARLLAALKSSEKASLSTRTSDALRSRWLRVRVINMATGKPKVNVNLPLGLVGVGRDPVRARTGGIRHRRVDDRHRRRRTGQDH